MTIHRFFIDPELIQNNQAILPEEISHQISQVLRLKQGDQIIILDNSGTEYLCTLTKIDKRHTEAKVFKKQQNQNEPELKVHLYQSLITRDNFELVLQKSVELGVAEITPIQTERTQFTATWAQDKRERWQKIIREAAEQSERGKLPTLNNPINYESAIGQATQNSETLIAWEKENVQTSLRGVPTTKQSQSTKKTDSRLRGNDDTIKQISIFIGPEGGFTEEEITVAKKQNAKMISLGRFILRSETAAIALLAKLLL